jgi:alpha-amylase
LRSAVKNNKFSAKGLEDWRHPAAPKNIVTWIESHDTYANHGESAALTHAQLRAGWALITARAGGTPLFFSRPQGPEATQFPGVSKIGDIGNNEFKHPEVVAVNKFRTAMVGQDETLINGENTGVLIVKRGDKGAVIINVNQGGKSKVSFELNLPDGTYKDKANKLKYTVKDGVVNITVPRKKIAVIY